MQRLFGEVFGSYDLAQGPVEITAPVLIVHGRYDYAVAYTGWEEHRHKAPQAQLCAIREQRAFPPLEEPSGSIRRCSRGSTNLGAQAADAGAS
jgi:pimeloyl-ACP methyl ester carboxylesterase